MRIWLLPDRLAQLKLTPSDVIRAVNEQNAQFAAGKVGQAPIGRGQDLVYTITTQGRLSDPKEFATDHRARESRRLDRAARPTSRASSWAPRTTTSSAATTARKPRSSASSCSPAPMRSRSRRPCAPRWPTSSATLPAGPDATRSPTTRRASSRCRSREVRQHARRGDDPRVPRRLPVPAELARDDHPVRRGAGVADRHVRGPVPARLLDQHADAVRHGAGDRHRRRRRDRRAGERRAHHARGRRQAARGRDQGDARGDRARSSPSC